MQNLKSLYFIYQIMSNLLIIAELLPLSERMFNMIMEAIHPLYLGKIGFNKSVILLLIY